MKNKSKKAQTIIITTLLLILLIVVAIVILWRVVESTVSESAQEVPAQKACLTYKIDIYRADNGTTNNLILERDVGGIEGDLAGVKVYLGNETTGYKFIENVEIPNEMREHEQRGFNLTSELIKNNATAVGKYIKIAKVVGSDIANGKVCDFDGKSARFGIKVVSNGTGE